MSIATPGVPGQIPSDERFMRLALALGARHLGLTSPNPSVGAVVVDGSAGTSRILGQGVTQPGGRPHAEPLALAMAGEGARGATLYVSLEPCSHHGRTPPCVDAIVAAGIARVVAALEDPDPRVAGRGFARLREAGIALVAGVLRDEARRAHRGHILRVTQGRPCVTLKLARTTDGFAARSGGPRLLITGEAANARVHLMRAHADAILVGIGTVLHDDPLLDVRLAGLEGRSPVRVVVDERLQTPPSARLATGAATHPVWVVTTEGASPAAEEALTQRGVEVLRIPTEDGRLTPAGALRCLAARGITRVMCEGGPRLAEALAEADLIDELVLVTGAQSLGGGEGGVPALRRGLTAALPRFRLTASEMADPDRFEMFERMP